MTSSPAAPTSATPSGHAPPAQTFDPKSDPLLSAHYNTEWQSFLHSPASTATSTPTSSAADWVSQLDLTHTRTFLQQQLSATQPPAEPPRVLVLYGSLRPTAYSRRLALEFARVLTALGAHVLVYHPHALPLHSSALSPVPPAAVELRQLAYWSTAMVWVSNEQHGGISGVMKNQIDWIPLYEQGGRSPTEGKMLAVAQVNGSGQSYNACNTLRLLGRWLRMVVLPAQSSIAQCHYEFDGEGRLKAGVHRERLVDVSEELVKATAVLSRYARDVFVDRYSVREEKRRKEEAAKQAENQKVTEANVDDSEGMKQKK